MPWGGIYQIFNGIMLQVFLEKYIENKHLFRPDKNYHYFCKTNIPAINLILGYFEFLKK